MAQLPKVEQHMCNMSTRRRKKEKVSEEIFEGIMTKNCLKLMLDIKPQI